MIESPFHADELAAQLLAGGGPGGAGIRDYMPEQHRGFFASLRYITVTTSDHDGWPVATMLSGPLGFVHAPDPVTLRFDLQLDPSDPAQAALAPGRAFGVLGIDLATRRRNRANGQLATLDGHGMTLAVAQSFGNCPQYIQRRSVQWTQRVAQPTETLARLDDEAKTLIGQADTFFVASRSRLDRSGHGGADISHRGGRPGFVRIDDNLLSIPDFHGNRYFNTLGNFLGEPRGALLFIDFERGDLLHLQGLVEIDWAPDAACMVDGAERIWRVQITNIWRRRAALPLYWCFIDQAPTTANTGIWQQVQHNWPAPRSPSGAVEHRPIGLRKPFA